MKKWNKPEIVAAFDKVELEVDGTLGDHYNWNQAYYESYTQSYGN